MGCALPFFTPPLMPGLSHPLLAWAMTYFHMCLGVLNSTPAAGSPPLMAFTWIPTIALYACQGEESAGHLNPA